MNDRVSEHARVRRHIIANVKQNGCAAVTLARELLLYHVECNWRWFWLVIWARNSVLCCVCRVTLNLILAGCQSEGTAWIHWFAERDQKSRSMFFFLLSLFLRWNSRGFVSVFFFSNQHENKQIERFSLWAANEYVHISFNQTWFAKWKQIIILHLRMKSWLLP